MFQTSGHLDLFKARRLKTKEHALPSRSWPPCGDTSRRWGYQSFWIRSFVKISPQRVIRVTAQLPSANTRKNAAHPKRRRWGDSPMKSYQAFLVSPGFNTFFWCKKKRPQTSGLQRQRNKPLYQLYPSRHVTFSKAVWALNTSVWAFLTGTGSETNDQIERWSCICRSFMYKKSYDYSIFDMLLKDEWPNTQIYQPLNWHFHYVSVYLYLIYFIYVLILVTNSKHFLLSEAFCRHGWWPSLAPIGQVSKPQEFLRVKPGPQSNCEVFGGSFGRRRGTSH